MGIIGRAAGLEAGRAAGAQREADGGGGLLDRDINEIR